MLNNILNHCPVGTVAEVRLERVAPTQPGPEGQSGDELRLRVSDTGPGISPDLRRQMSRGFMCLDSKSEGFGLGLAICQKIAEVHGATLRFLSREDGVPGLVIEVVFPH